MPTTVGVIGMGYVGITLTAALATKGYVVHGVDVSPTVLDSLSRGRPHIFEPGIEEVFAEHIGKSIFIAPMLPPSGVDVVVLCVSTPVDEQTQRPNLTNLARAAEMVAESCDPRTLIVVRSTVPVGTSRKVVLPWLRAAWHTVRMVMAPERTIQGQALRELVDLPQVIGGLDEESLAAGMEFFGGLSRQLVPVSSLEAAELVKLSNNCHTDLIYSFGNEIALMAERHGLDPLEVIRACNVDYPRPDVARPGYVGGGCLSKDPYIMIDSAGGEREPFLVRRARELNEHLPVHVAGKVVEMIRATRGHTEGARLSVLGWAYKGWPATDDMRGTPIAAMMPVFEAAGITVLGHDPMVTPDTIRRYGGEPVSLDKAFSEADGMLVINDHPDYRALEIGSALNGSPIRFIYDSWRILPESHVTGRGIRYAGIGYLAAQGGARA